MNDNFEEYFKNEKRNDYIKLSDCKKGYLYKIHSRNLDYGIYDGNNGFIGIREKFNNKYLFTEYHYDQGPPFGTVKPFEEICELPDDILPEEILKNEFGDNWAENPETKEIEPVIRRNLKEGEKQHGSRQGFVDEWGKNKQRLPNEIYPHLRENNKLFKWLEKYLNEL